MVLRPQPWHCILAPPTLLCFVASARGTLLDQEPQCMGEIRLQWEVQKCLSHDINSAISLPEGLCLGAGCNGCMLQMQGVLKEGPLLHRRELLLLNCRFWTRMSLAGARPWWSSCSISGTRLTSAPPGWTCGGCGGWSRSLWKVWPLCGCPAPCNTCKWTAKGAIHCFVTATDILTPDILTPASPGF